MKKALRISLGILLICLGLLALLTPFTPGSWLALIGFELIGLRLLFQKKIPFIKLTTLWKKGSKSAAGQVNEADTQTGLHRQSRQTESGQ